MEQGMDQDLCALWAELAENPQDEAVRERMRRRLADLVDHVDACERCRAVSQNLVAPLEVFEALSDGGVELPAEERETALAMDQALSDDEAAIDQAVEDVLLPHLPAHLESIKTAHKGLTNLQIFLATNAVNLLVT